MAETVMRPRSLAATLITNPRALTGVDVRSAIAAGATATASLPSILLVLGVGPGLSSVSPWAREGVGASCG